MATNIWLKVGALGAVGAIALAACSKDAEESEAPDRLTIPELMGAPSYEGIDYEQQEADIQEAIAACMQDKGWEYIPVNYPDQGVGPVEVSEEDELERIKREGYGISYWTLHQGDETDPIIDDPWQDWVDPNQEYVSSLSEAEQQAYNEALTGTEEEIAEITTTEVDPETGESYSVQYGNGAGCQGQAYDEVVGTDITMVPGYWEAVQKYYEELNTRQQNDPRITELNSKWSKCMKEGGQDFENPQALYDSVYTEFQQRKDDILGPDFYKDPMEGWTQEQMDEFWATATQEEIDELYNNASKLTDDQRSQLESLLAEEIDLAVVEYGCSKDYWKDSQEIAAEIEEEYALEHEDELKALAASLAEENK